MPISEKKLAIISFNEFFNKNGNCFNESLLGLHSSLGLLRNFFIENNIELHTPDAFQENEFDGFIYIDINIKNMDFIKRQYRNKKNIYLILNESDLFLKENSCKDYHKLFDVIFSWDKNHLISNKYHHYYIPTNNNPNYSFSNDYESDFNKRKFACIIASNLYSGNSKALYSERLKIIDWYNKNNFELLDLYGYGWDKGYLKKNFLPLIKILFIKKIIVYNIYKKLFLKFLLKKYNNYRGICANKRETLLKYKFCFCYENAKDIPHYITEKIFDCFFSGTIPVYIGPKNSEKIFPNLFINARNFKNINELHNYLKTFPINDYINMRKSINEYLNSELYIKKFSPYTIMNNISQIIIDDLSKKSLQ